MSAQKKNIEARQCTFVLERRVVDISLISRPVVALRADVEVARTQRPGLPQINAYSNRRSRGAGRNYNGRQRLRRRVLCLLS